MLTKLVLKEKHLVLLVSFFSSFAAVWGCSTYKVTGALVQKGVEGEYKFFNECKVPNRDGKMYVQTEPAAGWGSTFYLYYYNDSANLPMWKGWIFSLYPCSNIEFARSASEALTPDQVDQPWEEYVSGSFEENPTLQVKCQDSVTVTLVLVVAGFCLLAIALLIVLPIIFIKKFHNASSNTNSEAIDEQRNRSNAFEPPLYDTIVPADYLNGGSSPILPPPYSEIDQGASLAHHQDGSNKTTISTNHENYTLSPSQNNNNNCTNINSSCQADLFLEDTNTVLNTEAECDAVNSRPMGINMGYVNYALSDTNNNVIPNAEISAANDCDPPPPYIEEIDEYTI